MMSTPVSVALLSALNNHSVIDKLTLVKPTNANKKTVKPWITIGLVTKYIMSAIFDYR